MTKDEAIEVIEETIDDLCDGRILDLVPVRVSALEVAIEALEVLPSAERVGKWMFVERREPQYDIDGVKTWAIAYRCSECGFIHSVIEDFGHYGFCPNCGARMVSEDV